MSILHPALATRLAAATILLLSGASLRGGETASGWQPDTKALLTLKLAGTAWRYEEAKVSPYVLPDPLAATDGTRVTSSADWESKVRPQTLDLFRQFVYGRSPGKPEHVRFEVYENSPQAMNGKATLKRVRITVADGGKTFTFPVALLIPNGAARPVPAFLLINTRAMRRADPSRQTIDAFWPAEEIVGRGYAAVVLQAEEVDRDKPGEEARKNGVRHVWAGPGKAGADGWATLSAWAWGASRVLDYLETDAAIDATKVAVVGHSRGGKASLWAGAQDERFALVVSNDSGHGGASLSRRRLGETITSINHEFPYWFCGNYTKFNDREDDLPVDQHQLISLIAPRAVYVASADYDFWSDQRGEYLALSAASPVYRLYGHGGLAPDAMPPLDTPVNSDRMGYHIRRGMHDMLVYDWMRFMDFADRLWRNGQPAAR